MICQWDQEVRIGITSTGVWRGVKLMLWWDAPWCDLDDRQFDNTVPSICVPTPGIQWPASGRVLQGNTSTGEGLWCTRTTRERLLCGQLRSPDSTPGRLAASQRDLIWLSDLMSRRAPMRKGLQTSDHHTEHDAVTVKAVTLVQLCVCVCACVVCVHVCVVCVSA